MTLCTPCLRQTSRPSG